MSLHNVTGVWNTNSNQYEEYYNYIYHNDEWIQCKPWVYINGTWQEVGGAATLMIPFILTNGDTLKTIDNKIFLVRSHI